MEKEGKPSKEEWLLLFRGKENDGNTNVVGPMRKETDRKNTGKVSKCRHQKKSSHPEGGKGKTQGPQIRGRRSKGGNKKKKKTDLSNEKWKVGEKETPNQGEGGGAPLATFPVVQGKKKEKGPIGLRQWTRGKWN